MINVRNLQQRLATAGYYHGSIDGGLGKRTYCALFSAVARRELGDRGLVIGEGCVAHFVDAGLTMPLRIAHFLANTATETGAYRNLTENLNYSAKGLQKTWPSRFPDLASTQGFVMNPVALANKVYASRLGNGNTASGDGYRYRGRGLIQLTGRSNYSAREAEILAAGVAIPLVSDPELASDPKTSVQIACLYWTSRSINIAADADNVGKVRELVNGPARHGLADTKIYLKRAKAMLL
ncbi:MAG: glycoside hydrolase family 19 protein [Sphingopyxis sp.]